MKTIEISDEMYHQLIELANEMTSQDMRYTKMPHMFQIKTEEKVAAYEGCGETIWVDDEGETLDNDEEIKDFIITYFFENDESLKDIESDIEAKEEATKLYNKMNEFDIDLFLEKRGLRTINVAYKSKYQNMFLTAKGCQQHIDNNKYHYNKPTVYLNHAWRNPEMELVSKFLCGLVGKPIHI